MASKRSKGTKDAGRTLFRGSGAAAVGAIVTGAAGERRRGPEKDPRRADLRRALYRFRPGQLEALGDAARAETKAGRAIGYDVSRVLRKIVNRWDADGRPMHPDPLED